MNSENSEDRDVPPQTEEDLDSDVGTIFSDEEGCKELDDDDDEVEEGAVVSDDDSDSSLSSDSDDGTEKCPICLNRFSDQEIGSPEMCEHQFCLRCITAWSKKVATCPVDRKFFSTILVKKQWNGDVVRIENVNFQNAPNNEEEYDSTPTYCEVCGRCDREDRLLLCDGCDLGYHLECLDPPLEYVPIEDWFCPTCILQGRNLEEEEEAPDPVVRTTRSQNNIRIPRTLQAQRILESILIPEEEEEEGPIGIAPTLPVPKPRRKRATTKRKTTTKRTKRRSTAAGTGSRRKRRRKTRRRRRRVAVDKRPNTARGRIAHQLGIMKPLPGQIYVGLPPACRGGGNSSANSSASTSTSINNLRYSAGITPLRMFGAANDLSDLVDSWSDDEGPVSFARMSSVHQPFGATLKGPPEVISTPESTNCDVLGLILKKQYILLHDKNIKIARDGTLVPSISSANLPANATTVEQKSPKNTATFTFPNQSSQSSPNTSRAVSTITSCGLTSNDESNNQRNFNANQQQSAYDSRSGNGNSNSMQDSSREAHHNTQGNGGLGSNANSSTSGVTTHSNNRQANCPSDSVWEDEGAPDGDNDDEFDIYSDIEENPPDKAEAPSKTDSTETNRSAIPAAVAVDFPAVDGKPPTTEDCGDDHDSDQDNMVICEELEKSLNSSQLSETPPVVPNNAEPLRIETTASIEPQLPESPESIPLPDSPPPELPDTEEEEEEAPIVMQKVTGPPPNEVKVVKLPPRQEYDPSEPLTSSDEDEHSKRNVERRVSKRKSSSPTKLSDMVSNTTRRASPVKGYSPTKAQETKSRSQESSVGGADLSSIPIPPEEGRRPVIHFSIPTRHKLLPISSLMKRQKGVAKKDARSDGGGTINFQSEISKAFGNNAAENDGTDQKGEHEEGENLPKISLVAEIFGSDEEEEEEEIVAATAPAPAVSNGQETSEEPTDEPPEPPISKPVQAAIDTSSGLWKTLSAEPEPVLPPAPLVAASILEITPEAQNSGASKGANPLPPQGSEDEPEIIEIVTINPPAQPLQPRRFFGGHMRRELETISDSDSDIEVINMVNKEEQHQRTSTPGKSKEQNKSRSKSRESSRSRSPDLKRRGRKRRFSGSSESHFEEGEIVDGNDGKKHKKEKKRKVKKQKPMRERLGKPPTAATETGDKNLSGLHSNISSEEDGKEEDKNVSWKKPSKRSQDANYRGAKGKSEHSLNRDKESDGSKSPATRRRGKGSVSPDRRAGAAYRRSHSRLSDRFSRSHSRDSWNRNRRKRSRSGSSNSYDSPKSGQRRHHHRRSVSPSHRLGVGHSRSPSKSPEPIRSRASHVSKGGKRSESAGSRGRDRTHRTKKVRKSTLSRSRSPASVAKAQKKSQKYSKSVDTHKKKKAKLKKGDLALTLKSKRRAKERLREKEKRKLAQKAKEEEKPAAAKIKPTKEKGEKKKRKREKSLSPVKAIVADGDSIVVSLSFQKEAPAQSKASDKGTSSKETKSSKKSSKRTSETSKYKEGSSTRSPATNKKLDLGAEDLSSNSDESTHERELGAAKVSSSGDGSGRILGRYETEPLYNATADSSKVGAVQDGDGEPIQGDSLVTSTRDSLDPAVSTEEEYPNSATSPAHSKPSEQVKQVVQSVSSSAHSPRVPGGPSSGSSSAFTPQSQSQGSQSAAGSSMQKSSASSIGLPDIPAAPTQAASSAAASLPQSQALRYPPPQTNMLTPVLATVATALLAVRQHNVDNNLAMLGDQMKNRSMMMMKNANARSGKGNRGGDSPVSPNSSDGDDLFEPPTEHGSAKKGQGNRGQQKPPVVSNLFDSLFGAEPSNSASRQHSQQQNKPPGKPKGPSRFGPPLVQKKVQRKESSGAPQSNSQNAQCDINVNEEMPASAVELSVQEKLLKKLNRQERVVEEVKLCLKPHYIKKHVTKEEYKEILRRAVPKVCHSKTGEINPNKIRELIEAYVRKFRHSRKKP